MDFDALNGFLVFSSTLDPKIVFSAATGSIVGGFFVFTGVIITHKLTKKREIQAQQKEDSLLRDSILSELKFLDYSVAQVLSGNPSLSEHGPIHPHVMNFALKEPVRLYRVFDKKHVDAIYCIERHLETYSSLFSHDGDWGSDDPRVLILTSMERKLKVILSR